MISMAGRWPSASASLTEPRAIARRPAIRLPLRRPPSTAQRRLPASATGSSALEA